MSDAKVVLCLGPSSSGKTLLIKALHFNHSKGGNWELGEMPSHRSTVGSGLTRFKFGKRELEVRDLGGQMRPIWPDYFGEACGILFVVDAASPFHASESGLILEDCLRHPTLAHTPFLVAFSKTDVQGVGTVREWKNRMFYENLVSEYGRNRVREVETSAYTALNATDIIAWLQQRANK